MAKYDKICDDAYLASKKETAVHNAHWLDSPWPDFFVNRDQMALPQTGIEMGTIQKVCQAFSTEPGDGFKLHSGLFSRQQNCLIYCTYQIYVVSQKVFLDVCIAHMVNDYVKAHATSLYAYAWAPLQ